MSDLIGIFGGTFDPPHIGHQILCAEADAQFGLDRLLWVLTPDPPHKQSQPITPVKHRLAMVRLAIADNPQFELSSVDLVRPSPLFSLDTVKIIASQYPEAKLVYLMGGDSLRDLPSWHRPADLVAALHYIGVMHRPFDTIDLDALDQIIPGLSIKVHYIQAPLLDISANEIRQRASQGRPFRYFLPPAIYRYIIENRLYI